MLARILGPALALSFVALLPAPASAQAALDDLADDLCRRALRDRQVQRLVAARADVVLDALGIDPAGIGEDDALLLVEEGVGGRRAERRQRLAADDVRLYERGGRIRCDALVEHGPVRRVLDRDQRSGVAQPEAAGANHARAGFGASGRD